MASDVESLSSMAESAWDMVDERSAASEGEYSRDISRLQTPASEIPEPVYFASPSIAGNDTSSDGQSQPSRAARFSHSRKDSSSDPPDTARPFPPKRQSILLEDQTSYIKFREVEGQAKQNVSFVLTEFDGADREKLASEYNLNKDEIAGTVRQHMGMTGLSPPGPFRVIYVGAAEMKETLINKIASALAASPGFSPKDSLNSSRVTIVPISSFADDSSPDVVLIDSMGIDMNIEQCEATKIQDDTITLHMTNGSTVASSWDKTSQQGILQGDYETPDLAVVYVAKRESSSAKMTRANATKFFERHGIPILLVSYDSKWKNSTTISDVDERLPHLAVEAFNTKSGNSWVLRRQAVDVNTFVNIDSAQLSRSLATLDLRRTLSPQKISSKIMDQPEFVPTLGRPATKAGALPFGLTAFRIAFVLLTLIGWGILRTTTTLFQQDKLDFSMVHSVLPTQHQTLTKPSDTENTKSIAIDTQSGLPKLTPKSPNGKPTQAVISPAVDGFTSSKKPSNTDSIKDIDLSQESILRNKSEKFQAQVVGDSHVILRAPTWFSRASTQPKLEIHVRRSKELVPHQISKLFAGVYAVKFAPEHAHGAMVITISAQSQPKVHQVFNVELGSPWLKISHWQQAVSTMKNYVAEDFSISRAGIQKVYLHSGDRVQHFFKDIVTKADGLIKEAEKLSLASLSSTLLNTDQLVNQTKSLTKSLTHRMRIAANSATPWIFAVQHAAFANDLSDYSKKVSAMVNLRARHLTTVASSIANIGQDIQRYRTTHFVAEQARLVYVWWSIFGVPKHIRALHQQTQDAIDEDVCTGGRRTCSERRAARRLRRELRKRRRTGYVNDDDEDEDESPVLKNIRDRYRRLMGFDDEY